MLNIDPCGHRIHRNPPERAGKERGFPRGASLMDDSLLAAVSRKGLFDTPCFDLKENDEQSTENGVTRLLISYF